MDNSSDLSRTCAQEPSSGILDKVKIFKRAWMEAILLFWQQNQELARFELRSHHLFKLYAKENMEFIMVSDNM